MQYWFATRPCTMLESSFTRLASKGGGIMGARGAESIFFTTVVCQMIPGLQWLCISRQSITESRKNIRLLSCPSFKYLLYLKHTVCLPRISILRNKKGLACEIAPTISPSSMWLHYACSSSFRPWALPQLYNSYIAITASDLVSTSLLDLLAQDFIPVYLVQKLHAPCFSSSEFSRSVK